MLSPISDTLTAPQKLALQYVPPTDRALLAHLLSFDHRLALVVRQMSEPVIAQMRMAWWREKLALSGVLRPSGEPYFSALTQLSPDQSAVAEQSMLLIIDAWDSLIAASEWNHDVITQHVQYRAEAIFGNYAMRTMPDPNSIDVMNVGRRWALADLQLLFPERNVTIISVPSQRLPRQLRSLAILERAASLDLNQMNDGQAPRLGAWFSLLACALTGR